MSNEIWRKNLDDVFGSWNAGGMVDAILVINVRSSCVQ